MFIRAKRIEEISDEHHNERVEARIAELQHLHSQTEFTDPDNYEGSVFQKYILLASKIRPLTLSEKFSNSILSVIVLAGVLVGIQTYPEYSEDPTIEMIDAIILSIFFLEVVLKLVAEGAAPYRYFTSKEWKWNTFDFSIVVLSLPFIPIGGSQVSFLRLIRLMRVAKIFKKVPQLQMIVGGLVGGMKSIGYILVLLLLVFYLYAVAGMELFRTNDPWHFPNLPISLVTLFRCSTLEDWTDVMYINYYGCDDYPSLYVPPPTSSDNSSLSIPEMYYCEDPSPSPIMSALFFISFTVISALVMLSLFVGAVTMSMAESMEQMKIEREALAQHRALEESKRKASGMKGLGMQLSQRRPSFFTRDVSKDLYRMRKLISTVFAGQDLMGELLELEGLKVTDGVSKGEEIFQHVILKARSLADSKWFNNFITLIILLAGIQAGITTDISIREDYATVISILDWIILTIFCIEVVMRVLSEGYHPFTYFKSKV